MIIAAKRVCPGSQCLQGKIYPVVCQVALLYTSFVEMHGFYLSESVGSAAMISGFLVQSVDNTIRDFPRWLTEKGAKFARLRAQGGFLLSADQKTRKSVKLGLTSTVGGKVHVSHPGTGKLIERETQAATTVEIRP